MSLAGNTGWSINICPSFADALIKNLSPPINQIYMCGCTNFYNTGNSTIKEDSKLYKHSSFSFSNNESSYSKLLIYIPI